MAFSTPTPTRSVTKEIVSEMGTFIRIYSDGSLERPLQTPFAPPMLEDPHTGLSSKDVTISHNPPISARLYLPKLTNQTDKLPVLVYFHGGAFLIESAFSQLYHNLFKTFVPQANVVVVSVEYRLAPEHPLPACYHDCWNALQWVSSHATNDPTNGDPWLLHHADFNRVFIGGDSAGGNIAHNIAMRAGTEALPGDVKKLGAILCHPAFHSSYQVGSEPDIEPEQRLNHKVWNLAYPSAPGGVDNPLFNPVAPGAPSLARLGCSRILLCIAGKDPFRDRGVWYYESVNKSGWKGKLELFEETDEGHVYHLLNPQSENSKKLFHRLVSFLQE
ncbi:hypothetical protein VNO77_12410 [Canavalia gladiata]|uniref:Alpha/beta hydrolase fold-3 domain-containing protein n=1 Tax=Canavalia gladiata TaxID=3824 RepID=A0AAN9QQ04_CANGL